MSEITDVLAAIDTLHARGERMALATVVSTRGSTYRRSGARLLVPEHGASVGNISGGCLEGDVERIGRELMASGVPRLELFDLRAEDDAVWGYGLGCNGAIEVFIEPAEQALATASALRLAVEEGRACCLATVLSSSSVQVTPGDRALVTWDGPMGDANASLRELALSALAADDGGIQTLRLPDGDARVFAEVLQPVPRLLICGAGHDVVPLVSGAAGMGWRVTITDVRERLLKHERFPEAVRFIHAPPGAGVESFGPSARDYVVVMSHNYLKDLEYLRALLDAPFTYLGQLGPRLRTQQMLRELDRTDALDRLHAPAGLDIGGEGPEEVAWAVVAEMLAVRRGRGAGFLRDRHAPIHASPDAE